MRKNSAGTHRRSGSSSSGRPPSVPLYTQGTNMPESHDMNSFERRNHAQENSAQENSSKSTSVRNVREQIILIQMDIDDRVKVCALLEARIDQQRMELANVERNVREHYQQLLEVRLLHPYH